MTVRAPAAMLALLLATGWLVLAATPAFAACHVAGFVEEEVQGEESEGTIALVVELRGRVGSCAGTVDVATVDGTAVAGEDYEALTATLTFEENDDRVETVELVLLADGAAEGAESFTVELSNPTGSISSTGDPATVVIADADGSDDTAADDAATEDAPADDAATEDAPADDAATEDTGVVDAPGDPVADERGGTGLIVAVIALAVVGLAAFVVLRGRAG